MLVSASGYVTLAEIAENLFVSRATVINDLGSIRAFVERGGPEVLSRANKGLCVIGKESVKRFFLMRMLRGDLSEHREVLSRHISVEAGDRVIIQKIIGEQEHVHKRFLTDDSFQDILVYLGIMVNRNLLGEMLEPQPHTDGERYIMAQSWRISSSVVETPQYWDT